MNYNFISQLLDNGISEDQIIASLSKAVPHLAKKAKKMMSGGWTSKDIINMFSKDKEAQKSARKGLKPTTPAEMAALNLQNSYSNIPKGASEQSQETLTQFTKDIAPYALGYAGSKIAAPMAEYALSRALPNASPLLKNAAKSIGSPLQMPTQQTPPVQVNNSHQYDNSQQPPLSNANAAIIPEPSNIQQSKGFDTNIIKNSISYRNQIDALIKSGNGPEEIEAYLKKFSPQSVKTIEKEGGGSFKDIVNQYIQEKTAEDVLNPSANELKATPEQLKEIQSKNKNSLNNENLLDNQPIEPVKIEKNSVVSSPNGIGEVKEIRNGQAIVEVDGKMHKVKEEELQAEPEEVKKAKIDFNLDDVDESLRSAPLNEVYAPAHRKHVTIKYNSDIGKDKSKRYIFYKKDGSPVDESIIENLRVGSQLPISNGKTFWGGWSSDTQDSRGTVAYHELTKMAQKIGEEDDPSKPYWFEEEEEVFTHGYSKQAEKKLKEQEKKFNEANKKSKNKRA